MAGRILRTVKVIPCRTGRKSRFAVVMLYTGNDITPAMLNACGLATRETWGLTRAAADKMADELEPVLAAATLPKFVKK